MEVQRQVIETFEKALYYVDKILPLLPDHSHFNTSAISHGADWPQEERDEAFRLDNYIQALLVDRLNYAREQNGRYWLELTDIGTEAKIAGGHFAYVKKMEHKASMDEERQALNDQKLKYDVRNAKRIFRTYWWTFAISLLALAISLFNLINALVNQKN